MFTLGEMPENAPVTFSSDALFATINSENIRLWVAPEALVNSSKHLERAVIGICVGEYAERHIQAKDIDPPQVLLSYWVEDDEISDWAIRLFEVKLPDNTLVPAFIVASTNHGPDAAAEVSAQQSVPTPEYVDSGPLSIWNGGLDGDMIAGALNPEIYLEQKVLISHNIAHYGVELPISIDAESSDIDKVLAAGFLRAFMTSLIAYVGDNHKPDVRRFYYACVAYYNLLVENNVILPRQAMPGVFDSAFRSCSNLSGDWEVNMDSVMRILSGPTSIDSSGDWEYDDIVHEYDEEESLTVAGLQGLDERFPDGIFKSYIVIIRNPEIAKYMMPLEDLAEYMSSQGVPFPIDNLDHSLAYTYSTIVSWRNSAFREYVSRYVNSATGIRPELFFDDDAPFSAPNEGEPT